MLSAVVSWALVGCGGGKGGSLMVDTKVPTKEDKNALLVPYIAPDVNELAGIEEPDPEDELEEKTAPAPAPEAAPPTPPAKATPAKAPAKPEPKKPEPKK